jgi:Tfp pilus assembly protein PilO
MSRIQQWVAGTVVALLVIVAAGWFVAISPQKHKASNLKAQSTSQEQANSALRNNLARLKAQIPALHSEQLVVDAVTQKIPSDPNMPNYVRALTTIAAKNGVELISVAPSTPAAVAGPVAVVSTATPSASAPAVGASPAAVAAPAAPAVSLQAISVALTVQGGYFQIQQFTAALQQLSRSTVITSVTMAPGSPLKAPKTPPPPSDAYKTLQAQITVDVFVNSSTPFAIPSAPAQASDASVPGAAVASAAPAVPSASPSK